MNTPNTPKEPNPMYLLLLGISLGVVIMFTVPLAFRNIDKGSVGLGIWMIAVAFLAGTAHYKKIIPIIS
jgi:hypothetical protein